LAIFFCKSDMTASDCSESEVSGIYSRDKSITYDFNSIDSDVIFVDVL